MELYREWVGDALKKLENKDKLKIKYETIKMEIFSMYLNGLKKIAG